MTVGAMIAISAMMTAPAEALTLVKTISGDCRQSRSSIPAQACFSPKYDVPSHGLGF
jgi:hypothetical protein